jgi:hypothetical protein
MPEIFAGLKQATSAASQTINNVVAALDRTEAESPTVSAQDPAEMLNEIALDEELQTRFAPVLSQLGFEINNDEIVDSMGDSRKITIARRSSEIAFYVAYIPKEILEDGSKRNRGAFNLLEYLFEAGSVAYIISRNLWSMDPDFEGLLSKWKAKPIYTSFVPWNHVTKFLGETTDQKRLHRMKQMLKLDELRPSTKPPPVAARTELTIAEKEEVISVINQHASLTALYSEPQVFFNDLVSRAALPDRGALAGVWQGNPKVDANKLLEHATATLYPPEHERAGQNTLGWVLDAVASYDMSLQLKKILWELILKHNLISDGAKMEELRKKVASI